METLCMKRYCNLVHERKRYGGAQEMREYVARGQRMVEKSDLLDRLFVGHLGEYSSFLEECQER